MENDELVMVMVLSGVQILDHILLLLVILMPLICSSVVVVLIVLVVILLVGLSCRNLNVIGHGRHIEARSIASPPIVVVVVIGICCRG